MTTTPTPVERTYFFERPPWSRRWVCFALGVIFAALDFITGPFIHFPIFFVLPVMLLASNSGVRWAGSLALMLCLLRFSFTLVWVAPWRVGIAVLDSVMQFSVLLILAVVTSRLADQTRTLRTRVKTLEGILPICAFCKDICDESGDWQRMETYVSHRSEAEFSHGVCPKCAKEHYGKFLRKDAPLS